MTRPIRRLQLLNQVLHLAHEAGSEEAHGGTNGHTLRRQQRAQDKATQAGCHVCDVAEMTFQGLDEGRQQAAGEIRPTKESK